MRNPHNLLQNFNQKLVLGRTITLSLMLCRTKRIFHHHEVIHRWHLRAPVPDTAQCGKRSKFSRAVRQIPQYISSLGQEVSNKEKRSRCLSFFSDARKDSLYFIFPLPVTCFYAVQILRPGIHSLNAYLEPLPLPSSPQCC